MPNQAHSGWHGVPWHRCDRCKWEYRVSQLKVQRGLILCPKCWDNPLSWERDSLIKQVLHSNEPEPRVADILTRRSDTETYFD